MTDPHATTGHTAGISVGVDGSNGAAAALRRAPRQAQLRDRAPTAVMAWGYLDRPHPGGSHESTPESTPE